MRTTVTLDPDVQALIETAMRERGISFKQAVNDAIRAGLAPGARRPFKQRTFNTGFYPHIDYDKVMHLVAALGSSSKESSEWSSSTQTYWCTPLTSRLRGQLLPHAGFRTRSMAVKPSALGHVLLGFVRVSILRAIFQQKVHSDRGMASSSERSIL